MNAMSVELTNIDKILTDFNKDIKRIEEVGDFIINVSDQLKLLAFNASIEAARAGESGRDFAVVANEMNDMSNKTKEGMDTINKIVQEIIVTSEQVNESIQTCENTYNKSIDTFEQLNKSFRSINQQSQEIHNMMLDVSDKFELMSYNTAETKQKATQLFDTSQAISENTLDIAAVSEEVAAESNEIAAHTEKLGGMLMSIQRLLGQFNTAIVPAKAKTSKQTKIMLITVHDNEFWYGVGRGANYAVKELASVNGYAEFIPLIPTAEKGLEEVACEAINSAISRKFDGLIFPGWLPTAGGLERAAANGIKLMAFNCDCSPELPRVACLRPDPAEPGMLAAKAVAKNLDKKGNVIILYGNLGVGSNEERYSSFKKELANYKGIKIIDEVLIGDSAEDTYAPVMECLKNHQNVQAMFITNGFPCAAAKAIEDSNRKGTVKLYSFDHDQEVFSYIKKGIISTSIGQDSFGQGHDPIIWLYNHIAADEPFPGEFINCRVSVVDESNVDNLIS